MTYYRSHRLTRAGSAVTVAELPTALRSVGTKCQRRRPTPGLNRAMARAQQRRIRIGIDTGGTFTDVVALDEDTGELVTTKTPLDAGRTRPTASSPACDKVLDLLGGDGDDITAVSPRHDGRHQQAARGQGRAARLHHDRGLRVHPRDRPPGGARRLRQLLLLGQAAAHRPGRPRARPSAAGSTSRATRSGRSTRTRAVAVARWFRERGITTIGVCFLHSYADDEPRARDARRAAPRAPRRGRVDQLRGAARVPRVRARR